MIEKIIVLYSWDHRPDECARKKSDLHNAPGCGLESTLNMYANDGYELKSVTKTGNYTTYILQLEGAK